jgi:hypothetical protein
LALGEGGLQPPLGIVCQEELADAAPGIAKDGVDRVYAKDEGMLATTWSLLSGNAPARGS